MPFAHAGLWGPDNLDDGNGTPLRLLPYTVKVADTDTLAGLWADRDRATALPNPGTTTAQGNISFFADPGYYDLVAGDAELRIMVPLDPADAVSGTGGAVSGFASLVEDNTFHGEQRLERPLYADDAGTLAKPLTLLMQTAPDTDPVLVGTAMVARINVGVDIVTGGLGFALRNPIAEAWDGHGILTVGWVGADEDTGAPAYRAQFVRAEELSALGVLLAERMGILVPTPLTDDDATPKLWVLTKIDDAIGAAVSGLASLDQVNTAVSGLDADVTALEGRTQFLMPGGVNDVDYPATGDYGDELDPYVIDPSLHAGVTMQITSAADFHVRFVNPGPGWHGTFYLTLNNPTEFTPRVHVVRSDGTEIARSLQTMPSGSQTMVFIFKSGPTEMTNVVVVRL